MFIFSTKTYTMEGVAGMEGFEVDAFTMADHQRYFFFQAPPPHFGPSLRHL